MQRSLGSFVVTIRFVPFVCVMAALAVLCSLGFWQLERATWKKDLIAERQRYAGLPPVTIDGRDAQLANYSRARVIGSFIPNAEIHLARGDLHSGAAGYHVVVPFRLRDGSVLLVNRGFIPLAWRERTRHYDGKTQTIEGIVRTQTKTTFFTPRNEPHNNFWFTIDIDAMLGHHGLADGLNFYLDEARRPSSQEGEPIGGQTPMTLRDHHVSYAITWFSLALVLLALSLMAAVRRH